MTSRDKVIESSEKLLDVTLAQHNLNLSHEQRSVIVLLIAKIARESYAKGHSEALESVERAIKSHNPKE